VTESLERKFVLMRGEDRLQAGMFSYISTEARVPTDHPLRPIRVMVDSVLRELSPQFDAMYSWQGRPSIAPETLPRALLLQMLYTIRRERMLMEQLDYNLPFRWFVGLNIDDRIWDVTVFTKDRDRLLRGDVAAAFFARVLELARGADFLSDEHFTVDGTMIDAWTSQKSFVPKDGPPNAPGGSNPTVDFRGQERTNETHASTTDPDARLYRKGSGKASKLCYLGHVLMENRHGLVVDTRLTKATGTAEREAALEMVEQIGGSGRITLGADKGYDTHDFVASLRECNVVPHVAQNTKRRGGSSIDGRTSRHGGYAVSMRVRKRVEEICGWMKTVGLMRKTRHRGEPRVGWMFTFTAAAHNVVRIRNLLLREPA